MFNVFWRRAAVSAVPRQAARCRFASTSTFVPPESLVDVNYAPSRGPREGRGPPVLPPTSPTFYTGRSTYFDQLHTLEKLTRTNFTTLRYELTVDDPGAYTAKWTGATNLQWEKGTELFEYVCQQSNYAGSLMLGAYESVDRTAPAVP